MLALLAVYANSRHLNIFKVILFIGILVGYIQGMFLNGDMGILDGNKKTFGETKVIVNAVIWVSITIAILLFYHFKSKLAQKTVVVISLWLVLTQIVSLGVLIIQNDTSSKKEMALTTDGILEVSGGDNIIMFVLDTFDERRIDDIMESDEGFFAPLKDFIYYDNATSEFMPTYNSIPFLLTGTDYIEDDNSNYVSYAYSEDSMIEKLYESGYDIGVYTEKNYVAEDMVSIISNYKDNVKRTCSTYDLYILMTQCSKYKMAPFAFKNYFLYDTSDVTLLVADEGIANVDNDMPLYNNLVKNGLTVNGDMDKSFRFIHMKGAHPPFTMSEEFQYTKFDSRRDSDDDYSNFYYSKERGVSQAKGALKIVFEYISQLKEVGKYDDAMIVITADHGYIDSISDADGNIVGYSSPILFVKYPNSVSDNLSIDNAPVCHADLINTLEQAAGCGVDKTLSDYNENDKRIRFMKVCFDDYTCVKYQIVGNVKDLNSWSLLN
jgi:hypothetical protein